MSKNEKTIFVDPPFEGSYYGTLDDFIESLEMFRDEHKGYDLNLELEAAEKYGYPYVRCSISYTRPMTEKEIIEEENKQARYIKNQKAFYERKIQELEQKGF